MVTFNAIRAWLGLDKVEWPHIRVLSTFFLLPLSVIAAFEVGWLVAEARGGLWIGVWLGVFAVILGSVITIMFLLVHSISNSAAPLFSTRYTIPSLKRAKRQMYKLIMTESLPAFRVIQGQLYPDESKKPEAISDKAKLEVSSQMELFKLVGLVPAKLFVDAQSAVLIDTQGNYRALHFGKHDINKDDSFKGVVDLRSQRDSISISGVMTKDVIALDVEASFVYEIKQDKEYLKQWQSHRAESLMIQRALLPQDEWQKKTKNAVTFQVKQALRDCALWQLFIAPAKPPTPSALAEMYALGQEMLPPQNKSDLEKRIVDAVNEKAIDWGVSVTTVTLDQIKPPKEIRDSAYQTYLTWTRISKQVLEAEAAAQADLRTAQVEHQRKEIQNKTQLLQADTEAQAYEKQMKARADGALEFARQIQTIRQALGTSLDGDAMRELLRALGFMMPGNESDEGFKIIADALAKQPPPMERRK